MNLFSAYGLVIVDADDADLKRLFLPYIEDELCNETACSEVVKTIEKLGEDYKIQVNPRAIKFVLYD